MLDLILLPFHLVFGLIKAAFGLIGGMLSLVFGLLGGVLSLAVGLATVGLIAGLITAAVRHRRAGQEARDADEDFVSYYDHHGTVQ